MRAYLLLALAALVAGLGAWGYIGHLGVKHERAVSANLRTQVSGLADALKVSEAERLKTAKVSRELTARLKAQAAVVAAQKKELHEALKARPDWAAAAVPDGVWDALGVARSGGDAAQPGPGVDGTGTGTGTDRSDQR